MVKSSQILGWGTGQGPVLESQQKDQRPDKTAILKNEAKLVMRKVGEKSDLVTRWIFCKKLDPKSIYQGGRFGEQNEKLLIITG